MPATKAVLWPAQAEAMQKIGLDLRTRGRSRAAWHFDMGRPSTLQTRSVRSDGGIGAYPGGRCVSVFDGYFELT